MSFKTWSTTAASNATVDSINFSEGQAPSTVNDSARALMADVRYELATQDTIASATTTDLGSKDAGSLTVSGTTTITSFGTVSAGIRKLLTFSGALTLTHNGTSLILPGAANITTVAGDSCIAESLGSGNWKVHSYQAATVTGTGATVRATSPTLVTPALGTPASGILTNCTGYVGTSALVTTGALNSGSITSGFGSIDVGADSISGGSISGSKLLLGGATSTGVASGEIGMPINTAIRMYGGAAYATLAYFDGTSFQFASSTQPSIFGGGIAAAGTVNPSADNTYSCGTGPLRWSVVYAATGAINTSDARAKTAVAPMSPAEIEASKQLAREIGIYKWLSAVAEKGDAARKHVGFTVQRAMEIMQANGLDPMAYGFICYDQWGDEFVEHPATDDAPAWTEHKQVAGDRYAFRYDELQMFIARGFEARLSALEAA